MIETGVVDFEQIFYFIYTRFIEGYSIAQFKEDLFLILPYFQAVAFGFSVFFAIVIVYARAKLKVISTKEKEKYEEKSLTHKATEIKKEVGSFNTIENKLEDKVVRIGGLTLPTESAFAQEVEEKRSQVKRDPQIEEMWERVSAHISSDNSNDWISAIIEADIILGKLLTTLGYRGVGIGEQLKRVEQGDMQTLNQAWEAHKMRNVIAHEGVKALPNFREARRVIGLYAEVFAEFDFI